MSCCLRVREKSVDTAKANGADIYIAGEMGIGNTCSASALACLLLNDTAEQLTGVGTGIGADQLRHKIEVIEKQLNFIINMSLVMSSKHYVL